MGGALRMIEQFEHRLSLVSLHPSTDLAKIGIGHVLFLAHLTPERAARSLREQLLRLVRLDSQVGSHAPPTFIVATLNRSFEVTWVDAGERMRLAVRAGDLTRDIGQRMKR